MKMRKFIVEIHPDGRVTCCEYEEPRDTGKSLWLAGYRQAVDHCNEEVEFLGAAQVRDAVASHYHEYSK